MTTANSVGNSLVGQTGTGSFVGDTNALITSPFIITPALGTPSALVLTNATGDQLGAVDGSSAASGHVGDYFSQSALIGDAQPLSSGVTANVFLTTTALPPGDWDIYGTVIFNPDTTTTTSEVIAAISDTSATLPTLGASNNTTKINAAIPAGKNIVLNVGPVRSTSAFVQVFPLVAQATFAVSTMSVYGFVSARRVR
jgi:hypothetical protein